MTDSARTADERSLKSKPSPPAPYARASYDRVPSERSPRYRHSTPLAAGAAKERVASVDALRGFAMFWILAGDPFAWALHDMAAGKEGALAAAVQFVSDQFKHVEWVGLSFYDLLFPLFIFVIGVSIVFSLSRMVERDGMWGAHKRILVRSLLLFALGVVYYGGASNPWPEVRLLGVLQRIALCYLFASLLFLHLNVRGLIVAFVTLLAGYWALMTFAPLPESGLFTMDANLARWVDANYLPGLRFYGDWDPEGLLSTLPAIGTCLIGVFAGILLKDLGATPARKAWLLAGSGVVLVLAGHLWAMQFPVIKMIWTSSFVLVTGGYSLLLLGMFYGLMDVWKQRAWAAVFLWFGANAIALYMINNLMGFHAMATRLVGGDVASFLDQSLTKGVGSLVTVAIALALAVAVARFLHRRGIYLRV